MQIVIKDWPTEAGLLRDKMIEWLATVYPGAAIVNGDEDFEAFAFAGRVVVVTTEDTRTDEDKARGAH